MKEYSLFGAPDYQSGVAKAAAPHAPEDAKNTVRDVITAKEARTTKAPRLRL